MFDNVKGFPCPKCNPSGQSTDPSRRIKTTLNRLTLEQTAECNYCGLELFLDISDENNAVLAKVKELKSVLDENQPNSKVIR